MQARHPVERQRRPACRNDGQAADDCRPRVTAEQVRAYKPVEAHFRRFHQPANPKIWIHVVQSRFHDLTTARLLAIPCVWVNRTREPEPLGVADTIVADLDGLAGVIARVAER
jgi:hypothetical protein